MEQTIELNDDCLQDELDCPICGNPAVTRFYQETAEEQIDCYSCGYFRKFYISNMDEKENPDEEFGWVPRYAIQEEKGYGAYAVRFFNSDNLEVGSFANDQGEQEFTTLVERMRDKLAYAKYTKFVNDKLEEVILINTVE